MPSVLDGNATNVETALFHVRSLAVFRGPAPQQGIDLLLRSELPEPFQSIYSPGTNTNLAFYVGGNNHRKIVYVDGIVTNAQAILLINGYGGGADQLSFSGFNDYLASQVARIQAAMSAAHLQTSEYLDFVGYSAGGAVTQVLQAEAIRLRSTQKRKLITFGAPRAQNRTRAAVLEHSAIGRWMVDADPIPLIPPRLLDVPQLIPLLSPIEIIRWGNYVHTDGGISISENGATAPAILPPLAAINPGSSLSNWYFSEEGDPQNPHSLATYFRYLTAANAAAPRADQKELAGGADEDDQQVRQREVTAQQRRVAEVINAAGHTQNGVPQTLPAETLFVPIRVGKIWYVSFNGAIVVTAPIEKRARHIARVGNEFLRSLPRQALVDPSALAEQMQNWLALAQDPTFGFVPQLSTKLTF